MQQQTNLFFKVVDGHAKLTLVGKCVASQVIRNRLNVPQVTPKA
jgi:hypothetical protein